MAEKVPGKLGELFTRLGPPEVTLDLLSVPDSDKAGADFVCRHLVNGPDGAPYHLHKLQDKRLALCEKCSAQTKPKAAGAGQ